MSAVLPTILFKIPWTDVINNAPKIFESAKDVWKSVSKKKPISSVSDESMAKNISAESQAIAALETRNSELEASVTDLNEKMLAATEVIKVLAEQNAHLVQCIESIRVRILWLSSIFGVVSILSVIAIYMK